MEKGEREVGERKGRGGRRGEGEKGGNGSGPDQVREEIDDRVHTPILLLLARYVPNVAKRSIIMRSMKVSIY